MDNVAIRNFLHSIKNLFSQYSPGVNVEVGMPYLLNKPDLLSYDMCGLIRLSGDYQGAVYFTAHSSMLSHLLVAMGEINTSEILQKDLVGEIANTLSGNAREAFGQGFVISTPQISTHPPANIYQAGLDHLVAIPLSWQKYKSALVLAIRS